MEDKLIKESVKFTFGKILNFLEPKIRQTLENRIIEYITSNASNFSLIKTILHKDNVNLSQIYQPLKIKHRNNDNVTLINNFKEFLDKHRNVSLIASGGSGKTTFI